MLGRFFFTFHYMFDLVFQHNIRLGDSSLIQIKGIFSTKSVIPPYQNIAATQSIASLSSVNLIIGVNLQQNFC